jgi:adenine-specific DNA-methyltransferase
MSTNVSKQKRDDLIKKIKAIRTYIAKAEQDENTGNLLTYLSELEKEVKGKKYGIVFEQHREAVDDILDNNTPVLTEEKELFIDNGGQINFLIEGDNLPALELLQKTHKGKIDLIYIDPPYNTGNEDFMYDDVYVDNDDGYRHSKWLSFMSKRLLLCKKLLSVRGFIFISIDDKEASQLKILCDSIFDEANYEKTDYIQVRYPEKTLKTDMFYHKEIEQVLVYRRSALAKPHLKTAEYDYDKFIYSFEELAHGKEIELGGKRVIMFKPTEYRIVTHDSGYRNGLKEIWATGTILNGNSSGRFFRDFLAGRKDVDGLGILYKVYGIGDDQYDFRYFTGPKQRKATKGKYFQGVPIDKLDEGAQKIAPIANFYDMAGDFGNIRHEGNMPFNGGKKPVKLMSMFMDYFKEKDIIVLDFFAGSGSTGHALLSKNQDGGNRRFILVTNNQNGICRTITYPRIINVLDGFVNNYSLKYYKVDYIPISDKLYYEYANELLLHIRELVELENGINFTGNAKIAIVLTDDEMVDFIANIYNFKKCRKLYLGHDVLLNGEQVQILKDRKIKVNIIPDYYYRELEG